MVSVMNDLIDGLNGKETGCHVLDFIVQTHSYSRCVFYTLSHAKSKDDFKKG
jgi:hypothetical protein